MKFKIPFSGRSHQYTDDEKKAVLQAIDDSDPLTQGKYRNEFEKKFCNYTGTNYAFALNNATAALELVAQLCQFKNGDELIAPSHTFTASVYPFIKKGANVIWADIDINSHVVTAETIEKCITPNTKAILVVHLYGYMANMPEIVKVAKKHNLIIIEDVAQAIGTEIEGQFSGTFGDFGVFSFHSHKNMTTLGEGGMLTVRDDQYAKIIPMLRHNGHCDFDFEKINYWTPAMGNVDLPKLNNEYLMPNNYCLGEIECALGIKLLDRIDTINDQKRHLALKFINRLVDFPELRFLRVDNRQHNYHLLVAHMMNGKRDLFMHKMAREKGIQCIVQYYPLNRYSLYQKLGLENADCPNTDEFFDNMVSFPFHHWLSGSDYNYMLKSTKEVLIELKEDLIRP
ncbi:DegT/DnrJ/EryC1/StrS family aminotransferase [Caldithrix abyssi]|nr:DegT/DnrJ/EryC1/StrS family aminotransferase [Caldithrix abyssi]